MNLPADNLYQREQYSIGFRDGDTLRDDSVSWPIDRIDNSYTVD